LLLFEAAIKHICVARNLCWGGLTDNRGAVGAEIETRRRGRLGEVWERVSPSPPIGEPGKRRKVPRLKTSFGAFGAFKVKGNTVVRDIKLLLRTLFSLQD